MDTRSPEALARFFDLSLDMLCIAGTDGYFRVLNPAFGETLGWADEELRAAPFLDFVHPDDVGATLAEVAKLSAGVRTIHFENRYRCKDGSYKWLVWTSSPTPDGTLYAVARDVTRDRSAAAEAMLLRDRLVAAVESVQEPFALFDAEDRLVMCNSAYRSAFEEAARGSVVGRTFREIFEAAVALGQFDLGGERGEELVARRLAYRARPEGGFEARTREGRIWRALDRRTIEGGWVTTIWDRTDDAAREAELREARQRADAASAAKSEFLASMSHELRTPLNAILGFAQLLARDAKHPLDDRQKDWLRHVHKGGEHLLRLIDEVLDLARVESGTVPISSETVSIGDLAAEVVAALGPLASSSGIDIAVSPTPDDLPAVRADRTRLRQILLNFGSNAIKYNRAHGTVRFVAVARDERVRISVRDTGIGIPPARHGQVFEAFQRLGQETGAIDGTGIGLALSKRLATLMDGDVGFASDPARGSEFWVELPAIPEPRKLETPRPPTPPRGTARASTTVLYVEDNPANVALMQAVVSSIEHVRLLTAPSGEIGLELATAHRPDLVILDINLPGMNGYECLARLRAAEETADLPVMALSASAMERDRKRALDAGFARYLTKPVQVDELLATLEELTGRPLDHPRPAS